VNVAAVVTAKKEARPGRLAVAGDPLELPLAEVGPASEQRENVSRPGLHTPVTQVREQLRGLRDIVWYNAANSQATTRGQYERGSVADTPQPRSGRGEQHLATP
jgi:hypothetical protein